MDKLQKLLSLHKDKLGHHMIVDNVAREYEKIVILDVQLGGIKHTFSLNDLIFGTPFLSWLEWKEDGTYIKGGRSGSNQLFIRSDTNTPDYHKINLCLLDSDSDRLKYLEDNVIIDD